MFEILRAVGSQWISVHKTPLLDKKSPKTINNIMIPMGKLCNDNKENLIKVVAIDPNGKVFGSIQLKVSDLENTDTFTSSSKNGGSLRFTTKEIISKPSFADYQRAGLSISFTAAIDYTLSNGMI
jgi:hypothetical protein